MREMRVRFAPSPTGYLHIGGLRTALYNFLLAKASGGTFILRIEDTDRERSDARYEELQKDDLKWVGLQWDEGPYRQSERSDIYQQYANQLIDQGKAFYCFCSEQELEQMKHQAERENRPPHYDGRYRDYPKSEALQRIAAGEKPVVRFKAPLKSYVLKDMVRGRVVFPENMVGDFVIIRSNGQPVYNFCCVVDDWLMKVSHVVRGEDHLSNTVRQLMLYEAFHVTGKELPQFAHVSLLIGEDRQKLSKRHGVVSVSHYREQGFLPHALANYLCLLGYSLPSGHEVFEIDEIISSFDPSRFTKASALYDREKLRYINGQHLRKLSAQDLLFQCKGFIPEDHCFYRQSNDWQLRCLDFFKEQAQVLKDFLPLMDGVFATRMEVDSEYREILSWQTTRPIFDYLRGEVLRLVAEKRDFIRGEDFDSWLVHIKGELKVKGKPLFKGMRAALTGRGHGPELRDLMPITPLKVLKERMDHLLESF